MKSRETLELGLGKKGGEKMPVVAFRRVADPPPSSWGGRQPVLFPLPTTTIDGGGNWKRQGLTSNILPPPDGNSQSYREFP